MATAVIPLLHVGYTFCFWSVLGKVGGLGWFFFAPVGGMIAIYGEMYPACTHDFKEHIREYSAYMGGGLTAE